MGGCQDSPFGSAESRRQEGDLRGSALALEAYHQVSADDRVSDPGSGPSAW